MLRTIASLVGLASFATLLAEGITVGVLVGRGQVNADTVSRIAAAIHVPDETQETVPVQAEKGTLPSSTEVAEARTIQTLEMNARADDLLLLKQILDDRAVQMQQDRLAYEEAIAAFRTQLEEVRAQSIEEATEQARLIVKAMPARDAVAYLLTLSEPDGLRIVKGLPERTLAKILQEFASGTDEQQQRGRWLFEAIASARPETDLADAAELALPKQRGGDAGN